MKMNFWQVRICVVAILITVVIGQVIWIYNMYETHYYQLTLAIDRALESAIHKEFSNRHEKMGGTIVSVPLTTSEDSSRFITKTIYLKDTSFNVIQDRFDPHSDMKIAQFIIKDYFPIDVNKIDSILRQDLVNKFFFIDDSFVEYIDLNKKVVLKVSDQLPARDSYIASSSIPIDIFKSLGVKAYVHSSMASILQNMLFQLILSFILISICVFLLFMVLKTFFWREKIELMRQDSVNAMTHEFKRPISSAVAQAALIPYYVQKEQTEKVETYAENILLELNKLSAYAERIQKLSNNSTDKIFLNKTNISIQRFFEDILTKYQGLKEKDIQIAFDNVTDIDSIAVDKVHFSNMIENIIENSIKYSEETVSIDIIVQHKLDSNRLAISIKDNGFGIAAFDLKHIFQRFYRSNNKDIQKKVGFGLGLTYVKSIAEAHKGEVRVDSEYGRGTEFVIYLPI
mgnify:CR=1 FL=1